MKKFIKIFFISLGVIFLLIVLAIAVFFITDPFNLKSLPGLDLSIKNMVQTTSGNSNIQVDNIDKNPLLDEKQEAVLESLGVNPESLPTQITPEMQSCFESKLGLERVVEITEGSTPTLVEFLKVNSCIN